MSSHSLSVVASKLKKARPWCCPTFSLRKANRYRAGVDAGDHPPITPMRSADSSEITGDDWRVYDYITRHFIGSVSPDCRFDKVKCRFGIGDENFSYAGKRLQSPGFALIMPWLAVRDSGLVGLEKYKGTEAQHTCAPILCLLIYHLSSRPVIHNQGSEAEGG